MSDTMTTLMRRGEYTITTDRNTLDLEAIHDFLTHSYWSPGLSKWLLEVIQGHENLQGLRRFMLATRDAHGLYAQFGFAALANPSATAGLIVTRIRPMTCGSSMLTMIVTAPPHYSQDSISMPHSSASAPPSSLVDRL
jgi:hypothetical protein